MYFNISKSNLSKCKYFPNDISFIFLNDCCINNGSLYYRHGNHGLLNLK